MTACTLSPVWSSSPSWPTPTSSSSDTSRRTSGRFTRYYWAKVCDKVLSIVIFKRLPFRLIMLTPSKRKSGTWREVVTAKFCCYQDMYIYRKVGPHSSKIYKTVIFRQDMFQIGVSICRKRRCLLLYTIHSIDHFLDLINVHVREASSCFLICRIEASIVTGQWMKTTSYVELFRIQTHQPAEESSRTCQACMNA